MLGGQKMALHPMDYQIAPIPDNEAARLAALRSAMCAYVPREERFDRITRMAQRMLHVPMAMISIVEDDVRWFRSVQGLVKTETARDMSFCAHAIVSDGVFQVCDTLLDNRFNGLLAVLGPPFIRSYFGYPLELAPGLRVGSLCVMDTLPRTFAAEDLEIMADLAHMAEVELRNNALAENQKNLLTESSRAQRKLLLDPVTGTWSERGFEELIRRTLRDVAAGEVHAALCGIQIHNVADFKVGEGQGADEARAMLITQFIRQRLPPNAVLCRVPGGRACAMFAACRETHRGHHLHPDAGDHQLGPAPEARAQHRRPGPFGGHCDGPPGRGPRGELCATVVACTCRPNSKQSTPRMRLS